MFHRTTALVLAQRSPSQPRQIRGDLLRNQTAAAAFRSCIYRADCQRRRGCFRHFQNAWRETGQHALTLSVTLTTSSKRAVALHIVSDDLYFLTMVEQYIKVEGRQLRYIRQHPPQLRDDLYQGLLYAVSQGFMVIHMHAQLQSCCVIGYRPSMSYASALSIYQDAMATVQSVSKPDLLLWESLMGVTTNPRWNEIRSELLQGQSPNVRPFFDAYYDTNYKRCLMNV